MFRLQFTDNMAITIAVKIANGVNYMHSHNPMIIHQDIKPQNILVGWFNYI